MAPAGTFPAGPAAAAVTPTFRVEQVSEFGGAKFAAGTTIVSSVVNRTPASVETLDPALISVAARKLQFVNVTEPEAAVSSTRSPVAS